MNRARQWPIKDRVDFLFIHRHTNCRNHMAEVGHLLRTKRTFELLHHELMFLQLGKHQIDMAEML
jgi:hypothetical protein